ncbi:MAG TPA: non-canonical purine NTP pyrophosphatase, partial [Acidimicrobiales bacterium]|nr:non-canonical purine NTP pyrophosphatase [Acidimicrobiales bacterium]
MTRLVVASANPDKAAEIAAIVGPTWDLVPRPASVPDVVEDADTLEGNARLKAVAISAATGATALADDTGLEVDALGGAPGVRSARYAADATDPPRADPDPADPDPADIAAANIARLLAELERVGATRPDQRRARFRTLVIVHRTDGSETVAEGVVDGSIAAAPRGDGGFGYDP